MQAEKELFAQIAKSSGAMDAAIIATKNITVEKKLAELCRYPRCKNYGLSMSCPPNVSGSDGFKKLLKNYNRAIVFKIDVPCDALFSNERDDWFRLLHEIASGIEHEIVKMGYKNSKAFAGGSCKEIFCSDFIDCEVVTRNGECRNPQYARPSMSGFGINVKKLMQTAGFEMYDSKSRPSRKPSTRTLSGLVLID